MDSKSKHDNTGCTIPLNKCGLFPVLKKKKANSEAIVKDCFSGMWNSLPGRGWNLVWERIPGVIWAAVWAEMRFNGRTQHINLTLWLGMALSLVILQIWPTKYSNWISSGVLHTVRPYL